MTRIRRLRWIALLVVGWFWGCAPEPQAPPPATAGETTAEAAPRVELQVYAATSLHDVLAELAPRSEELLGVRPVFNFAASSTLAQQIVAGRQADVFFSADQAWMDHVAEAGLADEASRAVPLANALVVIVPAGSALEVGTAEDLTQEVVQRLALAQPDTVPAGRYAKAWLEARGVWETVADRVVPTLDVRAALGAVESGAVDAGIVYSTDAARSTRVRVALAVPAEESPEVRYAVAALVGRPELERARQWVSWLQGAEAADVFRAHGFAVPDQRP